jgi:hypothetical protein
VSFHRAFDVIVLVATLLGGAAAVILVLAPLVFETIPGPLQQGRGVLLSLAIAALVLCLLEWLVIR